MSITRIEMQETRLPNGMRVVSQHMPGLESLAMGVWIGSGARHEPVKVNGISHMLEHMAFKGTNSRSAWDIAVEIEDVGGSLDAYTAREQTAYYARLLKEDLDLGVNLIADLLLNSVMDADELAREQEVVLQEIAEAADTPDDLVFENLQGLIYPDHGLGRPILGSVANVQGFTGECLSSWLKQQYQGPRMVLAAAGAVDHDRLVALAEKAFADIPGGEIAASSVPVFKGGYQVAEKPLEQVHIALALDAVSFDHPDFQASQILTSIYGGGMSSRLFQTIREQRGLAYSIWSWATSYSDCGGMGFYGATSADQASEMTLVAMEELQKLADAAPDQTELDRARAQIRSGMLMSLEGPASRCEQMARQTLIYDRLLQPADVIADVNALTIQDMQRVAQDILGRGKMAFSAVGAVTGVPSLDILQQQFAR